MLMSHQELILRIAVAAILGGVIGYERDLRGRHAGLRTHLIVAMAAATFMVVSAHFMFYQGYLAATGHLDIDSSRIAASVVSGVGFIAGGTILRTGLTVQGLTTAASLWLVTAIGLCAGAGMFIEGFAVTGMGIAGLTLLRFLEDKNTKHLRRHITLTLADGVGNADKIMRALVAVGAHVYDFDYEKTLDRRTTSISFDVAFPIELGIHRLIDLLEKQEGARELRVKCHEVG